MKLKAVKVALIDCRITLDIYFSQFEKKTSIIQFDTMYYSGLAEEIEEFMRVLKQADIRFEDLTNKEND